jgi:large subunit ribosomal protein L1
VTRRGKRYQESKKLIASSQAYEIGEAVGLLKKLRHSRFDETVEICIRLGLDTRQADQQVRGSVALPAGLGKKMRVIAFCEGEEAGGAKDAGAVEAGGDELIEKISQGWLDFDVAVASSKMMPKVVKLGRILGPKGLMPSPKSGTVVEDVPAAVKEFMAGKVEYRADAGGNIHAPVGKLSFSDEDLATNIETLVEHIRMARPSGAKGT